MKKRPMKHSSLSFKLHKNERPEKEKGFYACVHLLQLSIGSFSSLASVSRSCQMGGFFIASESRLFHRVHSPPTGYSSSHPWRLVSVSLSQCCRVILSDIPISLKIMCLEAYSLSNPSYQSPCVSPTLIITSSTLVSCRLMEDTSRPSFDGFLPVDISTLSGNEI